MHRLLMGLYFCLVSLTLTIGVIIWWLLIKHQNIRASIVAVIALVSAHFSILIIPTEGVLSIIVSLYASLFGSITSIIFGFVTTLKFYKRLELLQFLLLPIIPLTLPGMILVRDLPISEQRGICYIENTNMLLQNYYQEQQRYPGVVGGYTFGENSSSRQLMQAQASCSISVPPPWHSYEVARTEILYQRNGNNYLLGGYYNHYILSFFGLTRVCHYNQATQDVACGFNNWAPFAPP